MLYNFDQPIDRRRAGSIKWKYYAEDVLPMWVADMDFVSANAIVQALREKVEHGVFGYELASEELLATVCDRMHRLYGWAITPEQVLALPGVVAALNVVCRTIGRPGDAVLIQTPVYPPFLSAPKNNQRVLQTAPLTYVANGPRFHYEIDYEALEASLDDSTRLFLLCHPHNPIGQTFTRDQLNRLAEICLRHNLVICSDEIHAELLLDDTRHLPLASLAPEIADRTITLIAPSKTFNIPGLGCSFAIVPNPELRQQLKAAAEGTVPLVNALGLAAAHAAYRDDADTGEWLSTLLSYLTANRDLLVSRLAEEFPGLKTTLPQATYLAWIDCREMGREGTPFEFFIQQAKVALMDGALFGPGGEGFVRLNFGCPRAHLLDGLARMKAALQAGP